MTTSCSIEPLPGHCLPEQLDSLLDIEESSFEFPWTREEFLALRRRSRYLPAHIDVALDEDKSIIGYLAYERENHQFNLLSIAVAESHREQGIGRKLVDRLIARLTKTGHMKIAEIVRESNGGACAFYKRCGFVASRVITKPFPSSEEDGFELLFRWEWSPQGREQEGEPQVCMINTRWCIDCGRCAG